MQGVGILHRHGIVNHAPREVEHIACMQRPLPERLSELTAGKISGGVSWKNQGILWRPVQSPLFLPAHLQHKDVDVIKVGRKAPPLRAFRRQIRIAAHA